MNNTQGRLKVLVFAGIKRGWGSFIWMSKIIIPISFLVTILQWTGWLDRIYFLLTPLTNLINLPPEAALPLISGMLINLYAAIAMMIAIPFTADQLTLIAVFLMICHNIIAEGVIQHKSGLHIVKATLARFIAATLAVIIVSQFLDETGQSVTVSGTLVASSSLPAILKEWGISTVILLLKILGIILGIMVILEFSETMKWTEHSRKYFRPLMKILGLSERTAPLWITSVTFGLMYGGAVIVDEVKRGTLTKRELEHLHISIGVNHSMVEDPALFLAMGLPPFWLWVPKLLMAIIIVQTYLVLQYFGARLRFRSNFIKGSN